MNSQDSAAEGAAPEADGSLDSGAADDVAYLSSLGYPQQLSRSLSSFASFAVGFSQIAVSVSIFTLFGYGLTTAGPAFIIAFVIGGALQMFVALSFAELVSAYPIAGGAYQIVNRITGGGLAWMAGWLLAMALVISIATNGAAVATYLGGQFFGWGTPTTTQTILVSFALIAFVTFANIVGVRFSAGINNLGVLCEIFGLSLIVLLLLIKGVVQPISFLGTKAGTGAHGYFWPFIYAFLFPVYMINAFDSTGHVGEETRHAARIAPRGAVTSSFGAYFYGIIALVILLLSIPHLPATLASSTPITYIVEARLNHFAADALTIIVVVSFVVASQMLQLTGARIFWAQARDQKFPFWGVLRQVSAAKVPAYATLLTAVVAAIFCLFTSVLATLASMVALAFSVANLITISVGLYGKYKGVLPERPWDHGRWGIVCDVVSIVWCAVISYVIIRQNPSGVGKGFAYTVIAGLLIYYLGVSPRNRRRRVAPAGIVAATPGSGDADGA